MTAMMLKLRAMTVLAWLGWLTGIGVVAYSIPFWIVFDHVNRDFGRTFKLTLPYGVALVGVVSLVVTVTNLIANWRRQKRRDTIEAWTKWSVETDEARRKVTDMLTERAMTVELARALVNDDPYSTDTINIDDAHERRDIHADLRFVLNGLERLGVGVKLNIYDVTTLRLLGGTIMVRWWERTEKYALEKREPANEDIPPQAKAYQWLEYTAKMIKSQALRDTSLEIDGDRLQILRADRH